MELFASPIYFLYFIPVLLLWLGVRWLGNKRKQSIIHALFGREAYLRLSGGPSRFTRMQTILFGLGLFFIFAALARPQWGIEVIEAQGNFAQTVIAIDVSASMRARDVKPDRLSSAKNMLRMLITHMRNERIGLIAFTSQAFIQCPITTDDDALKYFISSLQPDMLPAAGTSLAAPVKLAAHMLSKYPGQKGLILLTDGEDHTPEELKEAQTIAQQEGIRIIAIGIGTQQGELIPEQVDLEGNVLEYKKDKEGKTVVTKLDEKSLAELAAATQGIYIQYTTPAQVAARVQEALENLDKSTSSVSTRANYKNRYQIPLILAILCFLAGFAFPFKPRKKQSVPTGEEQKR